ncbi:MAG: response regulator transcription factor [Chitinophagaceae bacterium]|nr:response regulator transcription factor [Chitinophagaceae bacterium]
MNKVLLAEDHAIVIKGIKIIFEAEFRGYSLDIAKNSTELMRYLQKNTYAMAIIDLQLEDGDIFHLLPDIVSLHPSLDMLVFTANPEEVYAKRLFKIGVKGFLSKNAADEEITKAIRNILSGNVYLSESFKAILLNDFSVKNKSNLLHKLSARELEVANLLKKGLKTTDICKELNMQSSTIATHKNRIFAKLNISNIIELNELFDNLEES